MSKMAINNPICNQKEIKWLKERFMFFSITQCTIAHSLQNHTLGLILVHNKFVFLSAAVEVKTEPFLP